MFKTELVCRQGPWKTIDQLELTTLGWGDWYNQRRLHAAPGGPFPADYETQREREFNNNRLQESRGDSVRGRAAGTKALQKLRR